MWRKWDLHNHCLAHSWRLLGRMEYWRKNAGQNWSSPYIIKQLLNPSQRDDLLSLWTATWMNHQTLIPDFAAPNKTPLVSFSVQAFYIQSEKIETFVSICCRNRNDANLTLSSNSPGNTTRTFISHVSVSFSLLEDFLISVQSEPREQRHAH